MESEKHSSILQPVEPVQICMSCDQKTSIKRCTLPEASIYKTKLNPTLNPPLVLSTTPLLDHLLDKTRTHNNEEKEQGNNSSQGNLDSQANRDIPPHNNGLLILRALPNKQQIDLNNNVHLTPATKHSALPVETVQILLTIETVVDTQQQDQFQVKQCYYFGWETYMVSTNFKGLRKPCLTKGNK